MTELSRLAQLNCWEKGVLRDLFYEYIWIKVVLSKAGKTIIFVVFCVRTIIHLLHACYRQLVGYISGLPSGFYSRFCDPECQSSKT